MWLLRSLLKVMVLGNHIPTTLGRLLNYINFATETCLHDLGSTTSSTLMSFYPDVILPWCHFYPDVILPWYFSRMPCNRLKTCLHSLGSTTPSTQMPFSLSCYRDSRDHLSNGQSTFLRTLTPVFFFLYPGAQEKIPQLPIKDFSSLSSKSSLCFSFVKFVFRTALPDGRCCSQCPVPVSSNWNAYCTYNLIAIRRLSESLF